MQPQSSGTFFESQSTYYPVPPPPANLHEEAASSEMLEPGEGNSKGRCAEDADDALQAGSAQATELLPPNQLLQSSPNSSSISPPLLGQHHQHQHQLSYQQVLMGGSSASMQDLQQQQQQQQQEQIDQATLEQQQQQLLAEYTGGHPILLPASPFGGANGKASSLANGSGGGPGTVHSTAEYLQQLLKDRARLTAFPGTFIHAERLLDAGKLYFVLFCFGLILTLLRLACAFEFVGFFFFFMRQKKHLSSC